MTFSPKANQSASELYACLGYQSKAAAACRVGKLISTWTAFWLFSKFFSLLPLRQLLPVPLAWQPKAKTHWRLWLSNAWIQICFGRSTAFITQNTPSIPFQVNLPKKKIWVFLANLRKLYYKWSANNSEQNESPSVWQQPHVRKDKRQIMFSQNPSECSWLDSSASSLKWIFSSLRLTHLIWPLTVHW